MRQEVTTTTTTITTARVVELRAEIAATIASLRMRKARLVELVREFDAINGWVATGAVSCAH